MITAAEKPVTRNPTWKRKLAPAARWLHIYLSMATFAILLFFAVTGLTLNHTEWFADQQKTVQSMGALDKSWIAGEPDKLRIVEHLRATHGVRGAMTDFRVEETQISVSFKGPGYTADVFIKRPLGVYDVTETRMGTVAVWNDLHKGRDSGPVWSKLIDGSAIFMILVSITGLVLIFFLQKKLVSGMATLTAGAAVCYLIYRLAVP